jgi:hypothetical protein
MVNNGIDHSDGTSVFIGVTQDEKSLTLAVSDIGVDLFEKISKAHLGFCRHLGASSNWGYLVRRPTHTVYKNKLPQYQDPAPTISKTTPMLIQHSTET